MILGQLIFMGASALAGAAGFFLLACPPLWKRASLEGFKKGCTVTAEECEKLNVRSLLSAQNALINCGIPDVSRYGKTLARLHWAWGCDPGCTIDHEAEAVAEVELDIATRLKAAAK